MTPFFLPRKMWPAFNWPSRFDIPMNPSGPACLFFASLLLVTPLSINAQGKPTGVLPDQNDSRQALARLRLLLGAYEAGDHIQMALFVEPDMIGYFRVVNPARPGAASRRQLRISLMDTRTQASGDTVVIHGKWEKRYVSLPAQLPVRKTGSASFEMHRRAGIWRLSGLGGSNPFGDE